MSIRATFQPKVNEFISTLEEFSTGSYLKDEEKEFWEQPFDPSVLPELRSILENYLDSLEKIGKCPSADSLNSIALKTLNQLTELNNRYDDAVIEPEEKHEIIDLMYNAAQVTGADEVSLDSFPEFE